ncbi:MAG: glycosyltransferase [Acidimicrobiia bacterium]|nr:glycosyltransferase [Acidimicrobiia bacterium]
MLGTMERVALISLHTSPLVQPGSGDSGGMNVYVREVASALAQAGVECTTYTRADRPGLRPEVVVEPGHRVVHVPAGDYDVPKEALADELDEFTAGVLEHVRSGPGVDVVHGNYWLSGVVGHRLKHELDVPLVSTFHTLARVKAEGGDLDPVWRDRAEAEVIGCSDAICVSCPEEERQFRRLYGDPAGRIEIVPPAVEHAFFAPGDRDGARRAVGLPADRRVILFVGRLQPLKAPDLAISALAALDRDDALLVVVGGASGTDGADYTRRTQQLVAALGLGAQVRFVEPQPHHILSSYYRAADVVIVPSRSESFGLVALEAAACGVPVVASAVGGLLNVVHDGVTGHLVDGRDPARFGRAIAHLLDDPLGAAAMGAAAAVRARRFTWSFTAARLRRLYTDLVEQPVRTLVACT